MYRLYDYTYEIYKTSHIEKIYVCVLIKKEEKTSYVRSYKHMDMYGSLAVTGNWLFGRASFKVHSLVQYIYNFQILNHIYIPPIFVNKVFV